MAKGPSDGNARRADELTAMLARNPSDREAYRALHDLYMQIGDYASLANLVAGLAAFTNDPHASASCYVEAGQLAELRLDDSPRGENYYRAALHAEPQNVQASEALQALLERAERWAELADLIVYQLQLFESSGSEPQDQAVLQYRLGELFSKQFGDLDRALEHYRSAYELDHRLLRALFEARQIHLQRGDIREAALLYEKEAAAESDIVRRAMLLSELAEHCQQLEDEDGAVSALERAHALVADDMQLTHALAAALVRRSAREDERIRALDLDRVADLLCDIAGRLDSDEARAFLMSALGHAPWHARALYELEQSTPDNAQNSLAPQWVLYLANNPDGDLARERRVSLARAYIAAGQTDDAIFALVPAAKGGDLEAAALLGELRAARGEVAPEALDEHREAVSETESIELQDDDVIVEPDLGSTAAASAKPAAQPVSVPEPAPAPTPKRARRSSSANKPARAARRAAEPAPPPTPSAASAPLAPDTAAATVDYAADGGAPDVRDPLAATLGETAPAPVASVEPAHEVEKREPTVTTVGEHTAGRDADSTSVGERAEREARTRAEASAAREVPEPTEPAESLAAHETPADDVTPHGTLADDTHDTIDYAAYAERKLKDSAPPLTSPEHDFEPESKSGTLDASLATLLDETTDAPALPPLAADDLSVMRRAMETSLAQGNTDEALLIAERILEHDPRDAEAFDIAERQYRRTRDFRRRGDLLLRSAQTFGLDLATRKQRLRDAIGLFEQKLLDVDSALRAYEVLVALDPQNDEPVRGMARLLERQGRWDALCDCLERSLLLQTDQAQRLVVLRRIAELQRRERKDRGAAADTLLRLIAIDPSDRAARVALTEDLNALGRFAELTQLLERRIEEAGGKAERVTLLRQLANVFEHQLDDGEAAFEAYERILELAPEDAQALTRMEDIDEASGAHERLLATLNRRVERAAPAQAASLLVRMATIAEADLIDQERAYRYLRSALAAAPQNPQISTALANLCERAGRYDELLTLLQERVQSEKQAKLRADLERRIARLLAQRLQDEAGAAAAYVRLNDYGDDLEAWTFLEYHARKHASPEALATALQKLSELDDTLELRRSRLLERSALLVTLGRSGDAVEPITRVLLEIDGQDAEARASLGELSEATGDYRALARVLEELLARAESDHVDHDRAALAKDLALIYASQLPDDTREVKALLAWSSASPNDPEPYRKLATIYDRRRRHKELLDTLDALSRLEPTLQARAEAQLTAAELCWSKLKDADAAMLRVAAYVQGSDQPMPAALVDVARKADRLGTLCALCESAGRTDELLGLLRERIANSSDRAEQIDLYRQLATALIEHRQDDDGARSAYEGLLALGDDTEALRFVQAWSIRHDDPQRLAGALERLAKNESDPEERRDLWMELGRVLRVRLSLHQEAIAAFEQVLEREPQFWPAVDELVLTCELANDHLKLAAALERKLNDPTDAAGTVAVLRRLSDLYEGALKDDRKAVRALARWANLDGSGPEPLRRVRVQYERAAQWRELVDTLDALGERERDPAARVEATVSAALLAYEKLSDADGSMERLAALVPQRHPDADRALLSIAERAGRLPEVYELLDKAERYADLVEQLQRAANSEPDNARKIGLLRRAARALHERLNDADHASDTYAALLAIEEDPEALRFMQARAIGANDPRALADALLRLSKLESDPRELRDLLYEYAHLQHFRLQASRTAIPILRRILSDIDPEFEPALDELISAAEAGDDAAALAFGLERSLERETDRGRQAEIAERLALIYQERLHEDVQAKRILGIWIELEPDSLAPRRKLRGLLQKHQEHAALLVCLDGIAHRSDSREERSEAAMAAARLCLGPLHDLDAAFARLSELMLSGVPQAEDVLHTLAFESGKLDALCELYEQSERYDDLCALLRERAEAEANPDLRADLYLRSARILANIIGDEFAAADAYREALALREDREPLHYLRGVAERQDDIDTLDDLLRRLAAISSSEDRAPLSLSRALLLRDRLGRPAEAVTLLLSSVAVRDTGQGPALRAETILQLKAAAELVDDRAALAIALEGELEFLRDPGARRDVALRLADLYESLPEADLDRTAQALRIACAADPRHLEARRRLKPHLERQAAWLEYVMVLDALAQLEPTPGERRAARLIAASVAHEQLGDAPSALARLSALVLAGDDDAEQLAQQICRIADLGRELANLYISRARQATTPEDAEHSWREVMLIHEQWLGEPQEAFEASLRLLASDPHNRRYLDDVDRLANSLQALERLGQIYAKLVRAAPNDAVRVELCLRLSTLLEVRGGEPTAALHFAMQAARFSPRDASLVERVERLAQKQASHTELLWAEEQRAASAQAPEHAIDAWLAAARTADIGLRDREQANTCLRRALALSERAPARIQAIERTASELDATRPELGEQDARRALLRAHLELAEQSSGAFRTDLVLRAARFAREGLEDESAGFDALRAGAALPPFDEVILDALEDAALRIGRLDALDAQLSRSVERTDNEEDKRRLLARRARVLKDRLQRFDQAAQVYERLVELSPGDAQATELLLACLRKAGRHRELLRACERRLLHLRDPEHKLAIMREMATIWEVDLKNRASAVAIWNDVRELAPHDEAAAQALSRLNLDTL